MHNIVTSTYDEKVNRKDVQHEWDTYVAHEDWQEGASGLPCAIKWVEDKVFANREEAEEYIKTMDSRISYNCMAVKFKTMKPGVTSKTLESYKRAEVAQIEKIENYSKEHGVKTLKAEYIGCSGCGSKLNKAKLWNNVCPLCHTDLRSKTVLKAIEKYENNLQVLRDKIKNEEKRITEKHYEIQWLVKIEYHT